MYESAKRAHQKWDANHRDIIRHSNAKSAAKNFVLKKATAEELAWLKDLIEQRKKELDNA